MRIIYGLESPELVPRPRVIAMGAYDGVHRGHQALLAHVCRTAAARGLISTALTFEPIPLEVFGPERGRPVRLTPLDEKVELLEQQCLDTVIIADFSPALWTLSARDFARDVLVSKLGTRLLIASQTHTFGRGGEADAEQMRALGQELGFETQVLPLLASEAGAHISSTDVRTALWAGEVERAAALLGRPYSLRGPVVAGRGAGADLGFPTANIEPPASKLIPADGVYAALAQWDVAQGAGGGQALGPEYAAAVAIGGAPTLGQTGRIVEAHVLGEPGELRGRMMTLRFIARIRSQRRFPSREALVAQIAADVETVRGIIAESLPVAR